MILSGNRATRVAPGLRVIGRSSSSQFKGKCEDLRTIGSVLGAAYVLEGSVRRSGNRLRVTAQLIGTQDGSHLWAGSYDKGFGEVLQIQDQIAASLVRALQVAVGVDLPSRPILKSALGYDLYQRGRHALDRFDKVQVFAARADGKMLQFGERGGGQLPPQRRMAASEHCHEAIFDEQPGSEALAVRAVRRDRKIELAAIEFIGQIQRPAWHQ